MSGDNSFDEYDLGSEELQIANILIYGSPSAKQEIFVKMIELGSIDALSKVLNAMSDAEYYRNMPTA